MNSTDHISESLETILWVKILLNSLMRIRDGKNSVPGRKDWDPGCLSRNPQHCFYISLARDHIHQIPGPGSSILVNP